MIDILLRVARDLFSARVGHVLDPPWVQLSPLGLLLGYVALGPAELVPGAATLLRLGLSAVLIGYLVTLRVPSSVEEPATPV